MKSCASSPINKWPFLLTDILLIAFACVLMSKGPTPLAAWQGALCFGALALGGWLCAIPFLRDHEAATELAEAHELAGAVTQLRNLEQIRDQITKAAGQTRDQHENLHKSFSTAQALADRIRSDLGEFCTVVAKTDDSEKSHLRLEVEKCRRAEGEWLQIVVHILDHVHALHTAALRSGQPKLVAQLNQFQFACRDAVRRIGLVPFAAGPGDAFRPEAHQLPEGEPAHPAGTCVTETIALGFTYQGQVVRRAIVKLGVLEPASHGSDGHAEASESTIAPAPSSEILNPAAEGHEQLPL